MVVKTACLQPTPGFRSAALNAQREVLCERSERHIHGYDASDECLRHSRIIRMTGLLIVVARPSAALVVGHRGPPTSRQAKPVTAASHETAHARREEIPMAS